MAKIRLLKRNDWALLKEIRLNALKTDPAVFSSNHAKEAKKTDETWKAQLDDENAACFGIFDGHRIIGMTGVAIDREDPSKKTALLWGSWLQPEYRRKGLSKMIYEERIGWARKHPTCEKVIVSHRASNIASKKANQNYDFVLKGKVLRDWPDGLSEEEYNYELIL